MPKPKKKADQPRKKRKQVVAQRTKRIARDVARGATQVSVAAKHGVTQQFVSYAVRQVTKAAEIDLDDIIWLRKRSAVRMEMVRLRLLAIAGIPNHEDPDAIQPPPVPMPTADRAVTPEEMEAYKADCYSMGFNPRTRMPLGECESASENVGACRELGRMEQRMAMLLGFGAPKRVEESVAKNIKNMSNQEKAEEMTALGFIPPPGLRDMLRQKVKDKSAATPTASIDPDNNFGL